MTKRIIFTAVIALLALVIAGTALADRKQSLRASVSGTTINYTGCGYGPTVITGVGSVTTGISFEEEQLSVATVNGCFSESVTVPAAGVYSVWANTVNGGTSVVTEYVTVG